MKKLKAAIIGLGVGERHIIGYQSDSRVELIKLCDFDKKKLKLIKDKYPNYKFTVDANEILEDPDIDVISIATFDNFHAKQVVKAIENGKHVFVEKPICLYEKELIEIVNVLNKNPKCKLSSNFVLRKSPQFKKIENYIQKGDFGELYYIEGDYNYGRVHKLNDGWRGEIPFYSVMHGGGIHIIDLLTWISKKKVIEVIGIGNKIVSKNSNFKDLDMITSILRFENNVIGKVTANFGSVTPHFHKLSLYGTNATFINNYDSGIIYRERENGNNREEFKHIFENSKKSNVLTSFILSILENKPPDVSSKEVINVMSISLAIQKSLSTKNWEKVKYLKINN